MRLTTRRQVDCGCGRGLEHARAYLAITCLALGCAWAGPTSGDPRFVDVAPVAGLDFTGSYGPAFPDLDPDDALLQLNMGNGAAVGDYDGDGDLDVYLLGQAQHDNRLYRNGLESGSKTFTPVIDAGVDGDFGHSRVAHFADLDGDRHLDLLVVSDDGAGGLSSSRIFRNLGDGTFVDVTAGSGFRPSGYLRAGCSLADFDRDGLIDIYVTVWTKSFGGPPEFPGSNRLYRNLGNFVFQDVTERVGLGTLDRDSFTAIFTDFNGDTFPDLHVAIDHTSDEFYFNRSGIFENATETVGATHVGNDMGVAVADFDDDGDLDLYATNITDADGRFGTSQGNVLYVNQHDAVGNTSFVNLAKEHGVEDTYWGWGVEFVDVENDGDLDLAAVTGFDAFVLEFEGEGSAVYRTPSILLVNDGNATFNRWIGTGLDTPDDSRALVAFDYDRDGDRDLLVTNVDQPVRLYENLTPDTGHWLDVALSPDHLALGARVEAIVAGVTRRRDVVAGRSYLAGTPSEVHFGLGAAETVSQLRVTWADGSEQVLDEVAADQLLRLTPVIFADGFESGDLSAWAAEGIRGAR